MCQTYANVSCSYPNRRYHEVLPCITRCETSETGRNDLVAIQPEECYERIPDLQKHSP